MKMEKHSHESLIEVGYTKTYTEEELEKALHPEVLDKLKKEGFAGFVGDETSYFVMENDREFVEPPRSGKATSLLREEKLICCKSTETICYTAGICGNRATDNKTVLCQECVRLFIRNGYLVVDLNDHGACNDCPEETRTVRVHSTGRQLCMPCFKVSLERLRQKRQEEITLTHEQIQRVYMGFAGLLSVIGK
jgi:hypothetical protein